MNQLLHTVVCFGIAHHRGVPDDLPINYRDIRPEELQLTFNYGDTIDINELANSYGVR